MLPLVHCKPSGTAGPENAVPEMPNLPARRTGGPYAAYQKTHR